MKGAPDRSRAAQPGSKAHKYTAFGPNRRVRGVEPDHQQEKTTCFLYVVSHFLYTPPTTYLFRPLGIRRPFLLTSSRDALVTPMPSPETSASPYLSWENQISNEWMLREGKHSELGLINPPPPPSHLYPLSPSPSSSFLPFTSSASIPLLYFSFVDFFPSFYASFLIDVVIIKPV